MSEEDLIAEAKNNLRTLTKLSSELEQANELLNGYRMEAESLRKKNTELAVKLADMSEAFLKCHEENQNLKEMITSIKPQVDDCFETAKNILEYVKTL